MHPQPTREQLIHNLRSWGSEADVAATALADRGDRTALPDILRSIVRECGMEWIPPQRIAAFVRLAKAEDVPMLIAELEQLDEADLEGDAGDIGDEYWNITSAIKQILIGIGPTIVEPVRTALSKTQNTFARTGLSWVLEELTSRGTADA